VGRRVNRNPPDRHLAARPERRNDVGGGRGREASGSFCAFDRLTSLVLHLSLWAKLETSRVLSIEIGVA